MKKRNIIISSILLSLTLGLGVGALNINKEEFSPAKADEPTQYIYLDCTGITASGYSFFHPYVYFGGGGYASEYMLESVKENVYKYPIPEGATLVNFEDHYGNGMVKSEMWYDGHNWSIDIPETKRTFYITGYNTLGTISDPDAFYGEWRNNYDMPDEEGYYLVNSSNNYKYEGAVKMDEGENGDLAQYLQYHAESDTYIKVRLYIDNSDKSYPSSGKGYKPNNDKDVNVYISENEEFLVEDYVDKPEEDGYYIFGTYGSTTVTEYADAYETSTFIDEKKDYVTMYENIPLDLNDTINIKRYSSTSHPRQVVISPDPSAGTSSDFEIVGDSLRLKYDWVKYFDVYIKDDGDTITFLAARHSTKVYNPITAVFCTYTGEVVRTQDLPEQLSYSNIRFYPDLTEIEGAHLTGEMYCDVNCTEGYSGWFIDEPTHIYVKYLVPGYYFCHNWGPYTLMDTTNLEEGSLAEFTIHPENKENMDNFIFISYDVDSNVHEYDLVEGCSFAIREVGYDGNKRLRKSVEFKAWALDHYYRVSINVDGYIHVKEAGSFFCDDFISDVSNICDSTGANTNIEALQAEWLEQKAAFQEVEYKQEILNTPFQHYEDPQNVFEEMMSKYHYIITKYGSATFENFIFPDADPILPQSGINNITISETNSNNISMIIAIVAVSIMTTSIFAVGVLKKKKEEK